jgi:hypothetical protein
MQLYRAFDVWKRISAKHLVRYRCFQELTSRRYSVQSADFYRIPFDPKQATDLDQQHVELLVEQAPDERAGSFESIEVAIEAHDRDFNT